MGKSDKQLEAQIRRKLAEQLRIEEWNGKIESLARAIKGMGDGFRATVDHMEKDFNGLKERVKVLEDKCQTN